MTPPASAVRLSLLVGFAFLLTACATVIPPPDLAKPPDQAPAPSLPATTSVAVATPIPAMAAEPTTSAVPVAPVLVTPAEPQGAQRDRLRTDALESPVRRDLWARVRAGYAMPDLDSDLVRKWEQYYAQRPDYVQRMTARGSRYLFHIVEELERRNMPVDLALLPFIESAFDPQALSVARAAGMWQFMPGTGRDFELTQNLFRDDRRDILASTRAALDYLQQLYTQFNDWHLALAAYNWGQGNVQKALARHARAGLDLDYASLRMPEETRNYVPKLQAVKNILARPEDFALVLPPLENHPYFIGVAIERDIDVALAARLAGLALEQFQQLNPQLNKPVILAAGTPQVLLPYDNANRFIKGMAEHRGPLASWTAWVAPRTLKSKDAARLVGMSEQQLREVNRIPARMLVKAGSTLLVPRSARHDHDVAERVADHATIALAPEAQPLRRVRVRVGKRSESVANLARRHGMTAAQLAAANGVAPSASFKAGQLVTVLLPQRKGKGTTRVAAGRAAPKRVKSRHTASTRPAKPTTRVRVAMQ